MPMFIVMVRWLRGSRQLSTMAADEFTSDVFIVCREQAVSTAFDVDRFMPVALRQLLPLTTQIFVRLQHVTPRKAFAKS